MVDNELPFPIEIITEIIENNVSLKNITTHDIKTFTLKDQINFQFKRTLTAEDKNKSEKYIECENFLFQISKKKEFIKKDNLQKKFNSMAKSYEQKQIYNTNRSNLDDIKRQVTQFLLLKQNNEATEFVVDYIKETNRFYCIRDDLTNEIWHYKDGIYIPDGISFIEEICRNVFDIAYTGHLKNKVVDKIKADNYIDKDVFFNIDNPLIIPLENGLLNIKTKELLNFSPEYIFLNKLPVLYDKSQKCDKIIMFFKEVLKEESDLNLMQEWFGYTLWRKYKYQNAVMLLGKGRNGKSVTLELFNKLLGEINISSLSLQQIENDPFLLQSLMFKFANVCGDLSKKALKNTGTFKKLTGEDVLVANRKYKSEISFTNCAKLVFACNDLPYSYDDSDGFFDRWMFFDYPYKFVDDINNLTEDEKKLDSELIKQKNPDMKKILTTPEQISGLLNWSLDGLNRLWDNNNFSSNQTSKDNRKKWKRQASSFNAFIEDCCKIDFESFTSNEELKKSYQNYCRFHKLKFEGNVIIRSLLEQNGCDHDKINVKIVQEDGVLYETRRGWRGIKISNSIHICDTNVTSRQIDTLLPPRGDFQNPSKGQTSVLNVTKKKTPKDWNELGREVIHASDDLIDELEGLDCDI